MVRIPTEAQKAARFKPGNKIGAAGRPLGARHKFATKFFEDLQADWQKHGAKTIAEVRKERPGDYLKTAANLVPKELTLDATDEVKDFLREINTRLIDESD